MGSETSIRPGLPRRLRLLAMTSVDLHVFEVAWFVVDADARRRDPVGELSWLVLWPHQALDIAVVVRCRQHRILARLPFVLGQQPSLGIGVDRRELTDATVEG